MVPWFFSVPPEFTWTKPLIFVVPEVVSVPPLFISSSPEASTTIFTPVAVEDTVTVLPPLISIPDAELVGAAVAVNQLILSPDPCHVDAVDQLPEVCDLK